MRTVPCSVALTAGIVSNPFTTDAGPVQPAFTSAAGVNATPPFLFEPDAGPGTVPFDPTPAGPGARTPGSVLAAGRHDALLPRR
jgi:hypothetical protein